MWHLFVGDKCTAQYLNGQQYIDLGSYRDQCMGNLEMCPDGYTLAFWIKADDFRYCPLWDDVRYMYDLLTLILQCPYKCE